MPEITVIPSTENQYIEFKREETSAQTLAEEVASREELTRLFQSAGLFHYDIIVQL